MNLTIQEARGLHTKKVARVMKERVGVMSFMRSFYTVETSDELEIALEVSRGTEKIAADVLRGTAGHRNTWGKGTEKIFIPPYFREGFDATAFDLYHKAFGSAGAPITARGIAKWSDTVTDKYSELTDKIDRSKELQCAQVFSSGIVTLENGDNVDFKRKPESMIDVDVAGDYWDIPAADIVGDFTKAAQFLRNTGKVQGGDNLIAICGVNAVAALLENDTIKERLNFRRAELAELKSPQMNAAGGDFHGMITAGNRNFEIWSYSEVYENEAGDMQLYWKTNEVVVLPKKADFILQHSAVPKLVGNAAGFPQAIPLSRGTFHYGNRIDQIGEIHWYDVKAAFLPIPVTVDKMYTMKVLADV